MSASTDGCMLCGCKSHASVLSLLLVIYTHLWHQPGRDGFIGEAETASEMSSDVGQERVDIKRVMSLISLPNLDQEIEEGRLREVMGCIGAGDYDLYLADMEAMIYTELIWRLDLYRADMETMTYTLLMLHWSRSCLVSYGLERLLGKSEEGNQATLARCCFEALL
jgi:hypothetical protein